MRMQVKVSASILIEKVGHVLSFSKKILLQSRLQKQTKLLPSFLSALNVFLTVYSG